jgi:hypothetical protein
MAGPTGHNQPMTALDGAGLTGPTGHNQPMTALYSAGVTGPTGTNKQMAALYGIHSTGPTGSTSTSEGKDSDCVVCYKEPTFPQEARDFTYLLCCGAFIHTKCLENWLKGGYASGRCPACSSAWIGVGGFGIFTGSVEIVYEDSGATITFPLLTTDIEIREVKFWFWAENLQNGELTEAWATFQVHGDLTVGQALHMMGGLFLPFSVDFQCKGGLPEPIFSSESFAALFDAVDPVEMISFVKRAGSLSYGRLPDVNFFSTYSIKVDVKPTTGVIQLQNIMGYVDGREIFQHIMDHHIITLLAEVTITLVTTIGDDISRCPLAGVTETIRSLCERCHEVSVIVDGLLLPGLLLPGVVAR